MLKLLKPSLASLLCQLLLLPMYCQAQPGSQQPKQLDCGQQGNAEIICGIRAPEDFELTPDSRYLIVAKYGTGDDESLDLFDLTTQKFSPITLSAAKLSDWGDPNCTQSLGAKVGAHGLSLSMRNSGQRQLYVVNHNVRESVEMFELLPAGTSWQLVWHGCVLADKPYNDVAALRDGSFVATRPQAIMKEGQDLFAGAPSGNLSQWQASTGEQVLPGTDFGFPNGVVVSADERYAYANGWTSKEIHQYDLRAKHEVAKVAVNFMPDNLTWEPNGKLLVAGIKGVSGNCPANSAYPCIQSFEVAEVDPVSFKVTGIYANQGKALINCASVAFQAGKFMYIGACQGDRMVKLPR